MRSVILVSILMFSLTGCESFRDFVKPDPEIIPIQVPVYRDPPKPAVVIEPLLQTDELKKDSSDEETVKAYRSDLKALKIYSKQLEEALKPYREGVKDDSQPK